MMMLRTSLGRRRATLFAIATWLLVIGVAESDLVEGVTELGGSMRKDSSTADLQLAGTPGSAGVDPVQLHSEDVLALNGTNGTNGTSTVGFSTPGPTPPGLPSFRAMNERQRELLEAHEVLKTAEFRVVNKCMQLENKRSLTLVKKGLVLFQQQQRKSERGKGFIQLADEIATSVSHLVDLAEASGVFSGYSDDVSEKDLTVAAEAKALHMDQSAAEISGVLPISANIPKTVSRSLLGGSTMMSGGTTSQLAGGKEGKSGGTTSQLAGGKSGGTTSQLAGGKGGTTSQLAGGKSGGTTSQLAGGKEGKSGGTTSQLAGGKAGKAGKAGIAGKAGAAPAAGTAAQCLAGKSSQWACDNVKLGCTFHSGHSPPSRGNGEICKTYWCDATCTGTAPAAAAPAAAAPTAGCDALRGRCCQLNKVYGFVPLTTWGTTPKSEQQWADSNGHQCNSKMGGKALTNCPYSCEPTYAPSYSPTLSPTGIPTVSPKVSPTSTPTVWPTSTPSFAPSFAPSYSPSFTPTRTPSNTPSMSPTSTPSLSPTAVHLIKDRNVCDYGMEMKTSEQCGFAAEDFRVNRGYTYGGWHLAPPDATACDSGVVAKPDQCQAAIKWLIPEHNRSRRRVKKLLVSEAMYWGNGGRCTGNTTQEQLDSMDQWGKVPLGCSTDQRGRLHYKKGGTNCNDGTMQLVCSGAKKSTRSSITPKIVKSPNMPRGCNLKVPSYESYNHSYGTPCAGIPCGLCQGRCKTDSDCKPGLRCYHREGNIEAPGCLFGSGDDIREASFCALLGAPVAVDTDFENGTYFRLNEIGKRAWEASIGLFLEWSSRNITQYRNDVEIFSGEVTLRSYVASGRSYYIGYDRTSKRATWQAGDIIRPGQTLTPTRTKGYNQFPPPGWVPKPGRAVPCTGAMLNGPLCCEGSPYNDPDPDGPYYFKKGGAKSEENFCYQLAEPDWLSTSLQSPLWNTEPYGVDTRQTTLVCTDSRPTATPSVSPSFSPTHAPSYPPTPSPTFIPTNAPSFAPTHAPSYNPSTGPTFSPTMFPTPTEIYPEHMEKQVIRRQDLQERSVKTSKKHNKIMNKILAKQKEGNRKLVEKKKTNLGELELMQRTITTKTVYIEQLETMCNSNHQSQGIDAAKQESAKITAALLQVQLPPDLLAKSKAKVKMIQLIKSSLTKLLGLWKLDNAHGMYALRQEAHRLVAVEIKLKKLSWDEEISGMKKIAGTN